MKRSIASIVCVSMWFGILPAWASDSGECSNADDDQHGSGFSNADLCGPYGFSWDASAGAAHIASVGQFTADGRGNFSGERTVNTGAAVMQQTFHCSYETTANGFVTPDCTIMPGGSRETFTAVFFDDAKHGEFISTTAGVVARGVFWQQRH